MTMDRAAEARSAIASLSIGHVVSRGRTIITLEGRIEDAEGRLHAHGTSTCVVVRRTP
jgi:acyl-coenzyme A thioesterase PaaI-like protein